MLAATTALPALIPVFSLEAGPLTYNLKPARITDGVWLISGAQEAIDRANGGAIANVTIFDTRDGAVIVDTGPSKRYGVELRAVAEQITGKAVARVYLTHFHPDHVFGNQAFRSEEIGTLQGVIDGLEALGEDFASAMYHAVGDWMRGTELVLPRRAVSEGVEDIGGRRFRLIPLSGHTGADLVILEETSGVLVGGDLAFLDRAPTTPHAELAHWRKSLETLAAIGQKMLVPGHGPVEPGRRALEQTRNWIDGMEAQIRDAFERGLSMTEAMAEPLGTYAGNIVLARYEFERSVMHFYPKLESGTWPRVDDRG